MEYSGHLKKIQLEHALIIELSEKVMNDYPDLNLVRQDLDLIKFIMCKIVDTIKYANLKHEHIDTHDLFIKIYNKIYPNMSEDEKKLIISLVEHLERDHKIYARSFTKYILDHMLAFFHLA